MLTLLSHDKQYCNSIDLSDTFMQEVSVKTLEKGFQINVISEKNCPGLLVTILEAFEELGLNVVEARVSCTGSFHLEAVGEVYKFYYIIIKDSQKLK